MSARTTAQPGTPEARPTRLPGDWQSLILPALTVAAWLTIHRTGVGLMIYLARTDLNWSHAFLVPFISLWIAADRRESLAAAPVSRCLPGIGVVAVAAAAYAFGIVVRSSMVMGYAMVLEVFGFVLFLCGTKRARILAAPVFYLLFGVKITLFLDPLTLLLQRVAAGLGAAGISLAGIPLGLEADAAGSIIRLYHHHLPVEPPLYIEEACSGLRMLVALASLVAAWACLRARSRLSKAAGLALVIPLAVGMNAVRIVVTGLLYPRFPDLAGGQPHELVGLLMIFPALGAVELAGRLLDGGGRSGPAAGRDAASATGPARPRGDARPALALVLATGGLILGLEAGFGRLVLKDAIPPVRHPAEIPDAAGPYEVLDRQRLSSDGTAVLGTDRYVTRVYRDTSLAPGAPGSAVYFHAVYYTGTEETAFLRHTPEECYVAAGGTRVGVNDHTFALPADAPDAAPVRLPVREFVYTMPGMAGNASVFYFFIANGRYTATKAGIRLLMVDPKPYAYFCKLEILPGRLAPGPDGLPRFVPEDAGNGSPAAVAEKFARCILPQITACLPDGKTRPAKDASRNLSK